jgi:hypothetical protein
MVDPNLKRPMVVDTDEGTPSSSRLRKARNNEARSGAKLGQRLVGLVRHLQQREACAFATLIPRDWRNLVAREDGRTGVGRLMKAFFRIDR